MSALRVDNDQRDVAAAYRGKRTDNAVPLDRFILNRALPSDARGVDQRVLLLVPNERRVDRVPCGAWNVGNDRALLSEQRVHKAGFAHVRTADDRDRGILLGGLLLDAREICHDLVEHIAKAKPLLGGDADGRADAESVEVVDLVLEFRVIELVHNEYNGLFAPAKHLRHLLIGGGESGSAVHDEDDNVRRLDRKLRLAAHLLCDDVLALGLDAARVDQGEVVVEPLAVRIDAVARNARRILNYRDALAHYLIEKCRFAHVRAADYRYKGFHFSVYPLHFWFVSLFYFILFYFIGKRPVSAHSSSFAIASSSSMKSAPSLAEIL